MQRLSFSRFPAKSHKAEQTLCEAPSVGSPPLARRHFVVGSKAFGEIAIARRLPWLARSPLNGCQPAHQQLVCCLLFWSSVCLATARGDEPIEFNLLRLSSSQTAARSLQTPARFLWDQQPLRDAAAGVSEAYAVSIWIDRRIDPTQSVTYLPQTLPERSISWPQDSLGARLEQVLREAECQVGLVENVVVVGPPLQIPKLQAAAVRLHNAVQKDDGRLATEFRPLQWPELSTPQQLLEKIAQNWGITIQGKLPHDLMHAGRLQEPSTLATQLTLVCGGFGQEAVVVAPRTVALQPLSEAASWSAVYSKKQLDVSKFAIARGAFPNCTVRCRDDLCTVQGETNFHIAIQADQPPPRTGAAASRATWNFEIANAPAKAIMESLAAGINLEITWDPNCTAEQQTQLLSLKVQQATLDELLEQVCEAAGLKFTRQDKQVLLQPK